MRSLTLPLACLPLFAACAGSARPADSIQREVIQIQTSEAIHMVEVSRNEDVARRTLNRNVERVWPVVPGAFDAIGLGGGGLVPEHPRAYGFSGRMPRRIAGKRPSAYLSCGHGLAGPNANQYDVQLRVVTSLEPTGPATTLVATAVHASASPRGASAAAIRCTSSGKLEDVILEALQQGLAGTP